MPAALREYVLAHKGLELAVVEYGPAEGEPVLALHGWCDNAASFAPLAACFPEYRWIAPDFPGHGKSAHRHLQASYSIWTYLDEILALLDHLQLKSISVAGHSMGGAVGCLLAAVYPEYCARLVLLDTVGPLATEPVDAVQQLRTSFDQLRTRKLSWRHYYTDVAAAVRARSQQGRSTAAALLLAELGVVSDEQGCYWRLDTRLRMRNPLSFTEAHAKELLGSIDCPVLLVAAPTFWRDNMAWFHLRQSYFRQLEKHMLNGSHHQHMEAETAVVASFVRAFFARTCFTRT